jgi:hypothetical protein
MANFFGWLFCPVTEKFSILYKFSQFFWLAFLPRYGKISNFFILSKFSQSISAKRQKV